MIIFLSACSQEQRELRCALRMAGDNRPELKKVLAYFNSSGDEEKELAAEYLIRNMPLHHSFYGDADAYRDSVKALIPLMKNAYLYNQHMGRINKQFSDSFSLRRDINIITSDFLIDNINEAFDIWREGYMTEHLDFNEFCEYVLPYKVAENQLADNWREEYKHLFPGVEKDVCTIIDEYSGEPMIPYNAIRGRAMKSAMVYTDSLDDTSLYDLRLIKDIPYGDCISFCDYGLLLYRSKGLPVAVDYVPSWPDRPGSHAWMSILSKRGISMPVHAFQNGDVNGDIRCRNLSKVYRRTYKPNKELAKRTKIGYPIPIKDIFFEDVTNQYTKTETVSLRCNKIIFGKNLYVATYDNQNWIPVAYGYRRGLHKAVFENLGVNVLYLPVKISFFGQLKIIGDPFYIHKDGEIEKINPRKNSITHSVSVCRKYPIGWKMADIYNRTRMCYVLGSKSESFDFCDTLAYIETGKCWASYQQIHSKDSYRFIKVTAAQDSKFDLAEIKMYKNDSVLKPQVLFSPVQEKVPRKNTIDKIYDDDALTWFPTDDKLNLWAGMDFGEQVEFSGVFCAARSDGNTIYPGYEYILQCWNGKNWETIESFIGQKEITHICRNVPENALLILKCKTTGVENRPFLVSKNEIVWL